MKLEGGTDVKISSLVFAQILPYISAIITGPVDIANIAPNLRPFLVPRENGGR